MEAICSSETLVGFRWSMGCYISKDRTFLASIVSWCRKLREISGGWLGITGEEGPKKDFVLCYGFPYVQRMVFVGIMKSS
jgi:hypothetical protein